MRLISYGFFMCLDYNRTTIKLQVVMFMLYLNETARFRKSYSVLAQTNSFFPGGILRIPEELMVTLMTGSDKAEVLLHH